MLAASPVVEKQTHLSGCIWNRTEQQVPEPSGLRLTSLTILIASGQTASATSAC